MSQSKPLLAFEEIKNTLLNNFTLTGDLLIVEKLEIKEVKSKSGIVIQAAPVTKQVNGIEAHRPNLVRVIAVGEGYIDDKGQDVSLDTKPGDIVLLGRLSVQWWSSFGSVLFNDGWEIGIAREKDVLLALSQQESFEKMEEILRRYKDETASPVCAS